MKGNIVTFYMDEKQKMNGNNGFNFTVCLKPPLLYFSVFFETIIRILHDRIQQLHFKKFTIQRELIDYILNQLI